MFAVKGKIDMRKVSKDRGDVFRDTLYRRLTCIFLSQGELILFCIDFHVLKFLCIYSSTRKFSTTCVVINSL